MSPPNVAICKVRVFLDAYFSGHIQFAPARQSFECQSHFSEETMGMAVTGSKRKRQPAVARSELDKFAHKSGVLLQREAKKVRAFLVRKGVQQLKQTRAQLEQRRRDDASSAGATAAANGVVKLTATVQRLEREHAALKALDLRAVVARVLTVTGLQKRQQERQQQQDGAQSDDDDDSGSDDDGGRGGALSDDDGFDSEEYENARRAGGAQKEEDDDSADESDEEDDTGDEKQQQGASALQTTGKKSAQTPSKVTKKAEKAEKAKETSGSEKQSADDARLQLTLVDRVAAHKQMKALVEAIEKWCVAEWLLVVLCFMRERADVVH